MGREMGRRNWRHSEGGYTLAQVIEKTGCTRTRIEHWTRLYLGKRSGTGNYRAYTDAELELFIEAQRACELWGPQAHRAVFTRGARVHG